MKNEHGLALLLVVSLLALITVLVVSLAVMTRVETQIGATTVARAQARQNALFAIDVALGQLQRFSGPDTSVTALASGQRGLNSAYANNPHWVGTWPSDTSDTAPQTWLVSGNELAPLSRNPAEDLERTANPESPSVSTLFRDESGSGAGSVSAPKVLLSTPLADGSSTVAGGRYAWWASDESMKIWTGQSRSGETLQDVLRLDEFETLAQSVPPRVDLGAVAPALAARADALAAAQTRPALELLQAGLSRDVLLHELTVAAEGVLSSTSANTGSGLRTDLGLAGMAEGRDLGAWLDYGTSMIEPSELEHSRRYRIRAGTAAATGDVIDHVAPVLTDFAVGVYVFSPSSRNQDLTVRLQLQVELWNPYSSELLVEPLRVRIRGLPVIRVICSNGDSREVDLDALAGGSPEVELLPLDDDLFRFLPGRVLNWTGFGTRVSGRWQATPNSKAGDVGQADFPAAVSLPSPMNSTARIELESDTAVQLQIDLIDPTTNRILSVSESPPFEPLVKASYTHTSVSGRVSYRFRLADRLDYSLGDPHGWFFEWDVRNPEMDESRFVIDQPQPGNFTAFRYVSISDPSFSMFDRSASTQAGATSLGIKNDVVLFELPRQALTSLGGLQHLGVVGAAPFALGNRWANETPFSSALYDDYFFSGADELSWTESAVRNKRLRIYAPHGMTPPTWAQLNSSANSRASRSLMQLGPMNLNSTSSRRWAAAIGSGDLPDWQHVNVSALYGAQDSSTASDTVPRSLENAFFRFSQSAAETFVIDTGVRTFDVEEREFYRRGVVELNDAERDALGTLIATRVEERLATSGPFRSVGEFVASGIIADAIDELASASGSDLRAASRLGLPATTDAVVDAQAPSYLTQADVLTNLLPVVTARGDTFTVRVMGESLNAASAETAAVRHAEFTVQRTPEFVDPSDASDEDRQNLNPTNQRFGRRFVITQFRWLSSASD